MEDFSQLKVFAGLAVSFLGFTSFFLVLTTRNGGKFSPCDRHFVRALVTNSILILASSVVPGGMGLLFPNTFLVAATIMTIFGGGIVTTIAIFDQMSIAKDEEEMHPLWHAPSWTFATFAFGFLFFGLYWREDIYAYYLASVTSLVGISTWCFAVVVFRRYF